MAKLRTNDKQGQYILDAMDDIGKSGDAYCSDQTLYYYSRRKVKSLTLDRYRTDKAALLRAGDLRIEGTRIYAKRTLAYEESVACHLADILADGKAEGVELPETLCCGGITLNGQQRAAVDMALRSRLSLILGGAGSGKSTIIRAIVDSFGRSSYVLAAPTGKAARNLRERTGLCAFTVHSALGLIPDSDFLTDKQWSVTGLVVIDEASMVTLAMLAGLLCKVPHDCRVVLLGDPHQLLSVGPGNVISDLLQLGVPHVRLESQYRQSEGAEALRHNVVEFPHLDWDGLMWDESFRLIEADDKDIPGIICAEAAKRYLAGEDFQALSPVNGKTDFSVRALNERIRPMVNPKKRDEWNWSGFHSGDRVVVTKNFCTVFNGDVGTLSLDKGDIIFRYLSGGVGGYWTKSDALPSFALAYALTVHKSQGSQYDSIILPVSMSTSTMLYRNLLYTAISRAKHEVILVGSREAVNAAMQCVPFPRKSMLTAKTNMLRFNKRCA